MISRLFSLSLKVWRVNRAERENTLSWQLHHSHRSAVVATDNASRRRLMQEGTPGLCVNVIVHKAQLLRQVCS